MFRRTTALTFLLAFALLVPAAAPPPSLPVATWIEQLGSDDDDTRARASENLWKAGNRSLAALKQAAKHTDPDVVLRAQVILARVEWGIAPDTPAAVVAEIERFRDGDAPQKAVAVEQLITLERPGFETLRRLLPRADADARKAIQEKLKPLLRPAVRKRIVAGDYDGAEQLLDAVAASGEEEVCLDLAAFRAMRGTAAAAAKRLEANAKEDRIAAVQGTYHYRAIGDLASARRLAAWSKNTELLGNILDEAEDYRALVKLDLTEFAKDPVPRAVLLHKAGDQAGSAAAYARIDAKNPWERATVLFWTDRPREAIDLLRTGEGLNGVCGMLALQGRRREALALKAAAGKDDAQGWLLVEQAAVAHAMGDKDDARKRIDEALVLAERVHKTSESLFGGVIKAGRRTERLTEVVAEVGKVLDRMKLVAQPTSVLYELNKSDSTSMVVWWGFLRAQDAAAPPSALLRRMDEWFNQRKPGEGFDALLAAARKHTPPAEQRAQWTEAMVRVCVLVELPIKAEEILRDAARGAESAEPHLALGHFLFERKRWADAAEAYALALRREPAAYLPLYLRGVALVKAGKEKEGKPLIERARLLVLGDEDMRYELGEALSKYGLREEAIAEQLFLTRTGLFRSVLITNVCTEIGEWLEERGRYAEAARSYRRMAANMAFRGAGFFVDDRSHLWVPAWAHLAECNGLLRAGKFDEAQVELGRVLAYLPEETEPAIELIRAYDKAKRTADATKLFDETFAPLRWACAEVPMSSDCHNRLAWLAARTGRKLDWGLRHASAAVALQPRSAGVHDTLAEVRFQRGDRDGALAAIRRAVELSPDQPYFAAQLKRIEKGDPKADLPPQPR